MVGVQPVLPAALFLFLPMPLGPCMPTDLILCIGTTGTGIAGIGMPGAGTLGIGTGIILIIIRIILIIHILDILLQVILATTAVMEASILLTLEFPLQAVQREGQVLHLL